MSADSAESTNRLLKVMIGVMFRVGKEEMPLREQIATLSNLGLRPKEIAEVLGKTSTHVSKELSGLRKKKGEG